MANAPDIDPRAIVRDCVRVAQSAQLLLPAPAEVKAKGWLRPKLGRAPRTEGPASA